VLPRGCGQQSVCCLSSPLYYSFLQRRDISLDCPPVNHLRLKPSQHKRHRLTCPLPVVASHEPGSWQRLKVRRERWDKVGSLEEPPSFLPGCFTAPFHH
jgi:hypothetical protein